MMNSYSSPLRMRPYAVAALAVVQTVVGVAYVEVSLAQGQERITIDARRCRDLESPDERLACFDKQVDEAQQRETPARSAAPAPASPATSTASAPSRAQSIPTVDVAKLPAEPAPADESSDAGSVASIASLEVIAPNQYLITLDNGEVWRQQIAERFALRVGQRVRIEKTRFSTQLHVDGVNGFIRVSRVP